MVNSVFNLLAPELKKSKSKLHIHLDCFFKPHCFGIQRQKHSPNAHVPNCISDVPLPSYAWCTWLKSCSAWLFNSGSRCLSGWQSIHSLRYDAFSSSNVACNEKDRVSLYDSVAIHNYFHHQLIFQVLARKAEFFKLLVCQPKQQFTSFYCI